MNRVFVLFSAIVIAGSISAHAQVSPADAKKVAASFQKDALPGDLTKYCQATLAGGSFWYEETIFGSIKGVVGVVAGYAGGGKTWPTYKDVESGATGHAETVNIYYDSTKISFATLLEIFFESQPDPTQVNGQGENTGTQYRSIIFFRNKNEKAIAQDYIDKLNKSGNYKKPIAAQVTAFNLFWPAEENIQHYFNTHTNEPYVARSINAIARYQAAHSALIKPDHNFAKPQ